MVWHGGSRDGVMARFLARDWWPTADGTLVAHERSFDPLSGILTIGAEQKGFVLPGLYPILRNAHVGTPLSLLLAALVGGIYALLVALVLMRLSGLPAGIATFAVLGITYNLFRNWEKIGPAAQALNSVPGISIWALMLGWRTSVFSCSSISSWCASTYAQIASSCAWDR